MVDLGKVLGDGFVLHNVNIISSETNTPMHRVEPPLKEGLGLRNSVCPWSVGGCYRYANMSSASKQGTPRRKLTIYMTCGHPIQAKVHVGDVVNAHYDL
jgi:hypothetical protein